MLDQDHVAEALQFVAGIGDDAIGGGLTGAPSGAAMLIPSLRSPSAAVPNRETTLPSTGQMKPPAVAEVAGVVLSGWMAGTGASG
jgi:hypothetical protein